MNERLRRAAAHLFVADVLHPVVDDHDVQHLRVLRLRPGERVTVSDGRGWWRECRLADRLVLDPVADPSHEPAPAPEVAVGIVPVTGNRTDWAVQKLTEVGVDRIVVLSSARSVVRWDGDRAAANVGKLAIVAREASMQARRVHLPVVVWGGSVAAVAAAEPVVVAEPGGDTPRLGQGLVLVGPEGGWAPGELAGTLPRIDLGDTVLRAETAAVVAGALLVAQRRGR